MIQRNRNTKRFYRINDRISAPSLRVLDSDGKQIGVLGRFDALKKARELGLDLVEIAPMAKPPVAKIVNFNKFLYQEEKKKREEKRKAKSSETKEVRLGPFMDDHDLLVMTNRARDFLEDSNKVKLVVRFTGRQMAHPEFGHQIMGRVVEALSDISKVERDKKFEGRQLIAMLAPDKKGKKDEKKQEENK